MMKKHILEIFRKDLAGECYDCDSSIKQGLNYFYHRIKADENEITIENVEHFAYYYIYLKACYRGPNNESYCTGGVLKHVFTEKDAEADAVKDLHAVAIGTDAMRVYWKSPDRPNGLILTFAVSLNVNNDQFSKILCVSLKDFEDDNNSVLVKNLAPGHYTVKVMVRSLAGAGFLSDKYYVKIDADRTQVRVFMILLTTIACSTAVLIRFIKKTPLPDPQYFTFVYRPDCAELNRESITLLAELGKGQFGKVFEGIWRHDDCEKAVAVKTVKQLKSVLTQLMTIDFADQHRHAGH